MSALVDSPTVKVAETVEDVVAGITEEIKADAVATTDTPVVENPEVPASVIPDKYQGKTLEQVVEMHQNAEHELGRVNNDLGTQRQLTDRLLDLKRTDDLADNTATPTPLPQVSSMDLLDDPNKVLEAVAASAAAQAVSASEEKFSKIESDMLTQQFVSKHPDYRQIATSPAFTQFIEQSPLRQNAASLAQQGDLYQADILLDEYKAFTQATSSSTDTSAAQAASLETGGNPSGSAVGGDKQIYSRAALMELRVNKPEQYKDPAFQQKITLAYHEGRVK